MTKKREDSFLGIHFDFHAVEGETVARFFCPESFTEMLDKVQPDYLQFDTKGHPGLSSYPTKAGTQAKEIKVDILKFLRIETKKRNIALYGHHSGLYDINVAKTHPEWAVVNADGTTSEEYISPFSPYVDEVLLPQLKELALVYNLDGAWIDGECWGALVDYSENAKNAFLKKYNTVAPSPKSDDYEFYREFCRQGFRDYIEHYVSEIKKVRPDFQITSNWIYSPYMTEKKTVEVDFLSGDYSCANAVISGRHCGRYLAARNMTWDLMAWGQNAVPCTWQTENRSTKEENQYKQEASVILALGGGFQFFNIAYCGGGNLQKWALPIWQKTAEFCREREFCHKAKPYSNIAVMVPYDTTEKNMCNLYATWNMPSLSSFYTWISALCDIQLSPNVIFESELESTDLNEYELIFIPNTNKLLPEAKNKLIDFSKNGGVIIADLSSVNHFTDITGIDTRNSKKCLRYISDNTSLGAFEVSIMPLIKHKNTFGSLYTKNYFDCDSIEEPSAYISESNSGKIYSLAFDFTDAYSNNKTSAIKNWLKNLIKSTSIKEHVKVSGSGYVEVVTTQKNDDLLINLINLTGDHRLNNVRSYNEIIPLYNLKIEIDKDKEIIIEPEHKKMESSILERLEIHSVLIVKDYFK